MPSTLAGWGGPGSGLNQVLLSLPWCGLERGRFPCPRFQGPHPQGPWCTLCQWGRGLGSAPLTPLWSCRPLPGTQDSPGASPTTPCTRALPRGGPRQDGWVSWPVLLQVGNQVRAEWQAGLKRVPDSGSPGHSACLFLPRDSTPLPLNPPSPTQAPV